MPEERSMAMRRNTALLIVILVGLAAGGSAWGHHAMEYIEMESYSTARQGEFVFHLHYDYMVDNADNPGEDHWELTPGLSYGIADRLMVDVHTHFAKFGPDLVVEDVIAADSLGKYDSGTSPMLEAIATSLQYRVTEDWFLDIAVVGTVEVPFSKAEDLLGSDDLVYEGLLIAGLDFGEHSNITLNVAYEREGDDDAASWAVGAKMPISDDPHGIAAGVEVMGQAEEVGDNWSVLPGAYMPLGAPNVILKTGLEFGKGNGQDTRRANVTLIYRF
jgi:hypothetical protein